MQKIFLLILIHTTFLQLFCQQNNSKVVLETTMGNIVIELYGETPLHSENFTKLVKEGYYNNVLFHRVIKSFMIQAGDPLSKNAAPGQMLGSGGPSYTIPAEFYPAYYHKRGALAAARQPDHVNPNKESSGSQFYIVQGRTFTEAELNDMVQKNIHIPFTDEQKKIYTSAGGSPHLDYAYTVFGEITEGFDVLDKIASVPVDRNNRPLTDVRINKAYIK